MVCVPFYFFIHSFHGIEHFFFAFLLFRLERAVLVQIPSLRFTHALIYSLQMCLRTYVCRAFRPHLSMFLSGKNDFAHTLRFCLPLQMPTSMTTADMFAIPSTMFKLPSYATDLAHLSTESPSQPPSDTYPFNKLV